jgi:hypothetical protein
MRLQTASAMPVTHSVKHMELIRAQPAGEACGRGRILRRCSYLRYP